MNNQNPRGQGNQKPIQQPVAQQPPPRKISQPHKQVGQQRTISQPHKAITQPARPGPGIQSTRAAPAEGNRETEARQETQQTQQTQQQPPTTGVRQPIRPGATTTRTDMPAAAVTKSGQPDRRYNENRNLVSPERMRVHSTAGVHRTKDGAPDRRYAENQSMTDREAEIERARHILNTHTVSESESS
jgi:hypothetical protein